MRPIMYGYLRLELAGDDLGEIEAAMGEFAERDGWFLAEIFREDGPRTGELWRLLHAAYDTGARNVITPHPGHLAPGRNPERSKLINQLTGRRRTQFWYLDHNEIDAVHRSQRRSRDIPGSSQQARDIVPRTLIGRFELPLFPDAVLAARMQIHDVLVREGLRSLVEQAEQLVLGVLAEITAVGEPSIFSELSAAYPQLSPPHNLVQVWLIRQRGHLEVQVSETAIRVNDPVRFGLDAPHGRYCPPTGGTLTWARLPIPVAGGALPAVQGVRARRGAT
ncbi:hypothetical protein [Nocardia fluminea]|uniref:Resolvase-like protein n=1 Tax=Nocardia fluminea TaxID=134984 RepID=A0A2N3VHH5_9NOCA|nr:hypothetical protein [Nocardia fluminea]PKV81056.1 hypothetical protein ATK86_5502 [Nocardia fluminea]